MLHPSCERNEGRPRLEQEINRNRPTADEVVRRPAAMPDVSAIYALSDRHSQSLDGPSSPALKPKFDAVLTQFQAHLSHIAGVSWTRPQGGYFIDLVTPPGLAKKTVALASAAGITLTPAGAAYPYGKDPDDSHIRIAPSFPSLGEIIQAAEGIALALRIAIEA